MSQLLYTRSPYGSICISFVHRRVQYEHIFLFQFLLVLQSSHLPWHREQESSLDVPSTTCILAYTIPFFSEKSGISQLISGQMSRSPGEGPPFKCRLPERKWDQTRWHTGEAEQLPANTMAPGRFISGRAALGLAFSPARVLTDHSPPPTIWDVSCDGEGAAGWEAVCETGAVPSPLRSALHLAPYTPASQAALPYPTPSSALTSKAWLENQRPRFKGKGMEEIKKATVGGVWGAGRMGANSHHTDIDMPIDIDGLPWWLRP